MFLFIDRRSFLKASIVGFSVRNILSAPLATWQMEVRGWTRPQTLYWFRESDLHELDFEVCVEHKPQLHLAFATSETTGNGVYTQTDNAGRVWCAVWNERLSRYATDPAYVAPSCGWIDLD